MYYGQEEESAVQSQVSDYVSRSAQQISNLIESPQVQQVFSDLGLKTVVQSPTQQLIINYLAAFGMFSLIRGVKNNALKVAILGGAGFLYVQNRQKVQLAFSELKQEIGFDSTEEPSIEVPSIA